MLAIGRHDVGGGPERLVGDPHDLLRAADVVRIEGQAVGLVVVGVVRRRVADVAAEHQEGGPVLDRHGRSERVLEAVAVVGHLPELLDVPSIGPEACGSVVAEGQLGDAVDGDVVVVVDGDQAAEPEMAGERRRLVAHALLHAAITQDHERVVVHHLGAEAGPQVALGDRHPDRVAEALTERPGGDLHARGVAALRMSGCPRSPLAEGPQVVELEPVAAQEEQRVLEDRGVTVGEHEPVAVGPAWLGRVVLEDAAEQDVTEGGERHRGALVPRLRGQRRVHRHAPDEVDGLGVERGGEAGGHRSERTPAG